MNNLIYRIKKDEVYTSVNELKRLEYKSIINNLELSKEMRYNNLLLLNKLPRNSSKLRLKIDAILTGRGH